MPLKLAKFGIKNKQSKSSLGYVYNFYIYVRKSFLFEQDIIDLPFSSKVVLQHSKNLLNQGYRITIDNFFNNIKLFKFFNFKKD